MKKHKDYFMLPNKIFDLELKPRDFIVYSCLVRHKDNETHTCYPSRKLIAKECCITLRTVDKALTSLQNLSLIDLQNRKRMNGSNTTNLYKVTVLLEKASYITAPAVNSA